MSIEREICPQCHFEWSAVDAKDVSARIIVATTVFREILALPSLVVLTRPSAERWSILEYGAHLRDVMLNVRDRLVLTAVEDTPSPDPIYREERVRFGLYANESADLVARDLDTAARLFTTAFDTLGSFALDRPLIYSKLMGGTRTFAWVGAQVLHECEHHLGDARENLTLVH